MGSPTEQFLGDITSIIYMADLVVAFYGTGLFFWWWAKKRGASAVFAYVTFLFVGEIVETGLALYARVLMFFVSLDAYREFLTGPWWPIRKVVTLTAFICIVVHMSYRVFGKPDYRRRKDDLPKVRK